MVYLSTAYTSPFTWKIVEYICLCHLLNFMACLLGDGMSWKCRETFRDIPRLHSRTRIGQKHSSRIVKFRQITIRIFGNASFPDLAPNFEFLFFNREISTRVRQALFFFRSNYTRLRSLFSCPECTAVQNVLIQSWQTKAWKCSNPFQFLVFQDIS